MYRPLKLWGVFLGILLIFSSCSIAQSKDVYSQHSPTATYAEASQKVIGTKSITSGLWEKLPIQKADALKWVKYGNNVIIDHGNFVEITVIDDGRGAYLYLEKISKKLATTGGKNYKIIFYMYATGIDISSRILVLNEGLPASKTFTISQVKKEYIADISAKASRKILIRFNGLPIGAKIYIRKDIFVEEMQERTYIQPLNSARFKGSTLDITKPKKAREIQTMFSDLNSINVKTIRIQVNPKDNSMNGLSKFEFLADVVSRFNTKYLPLIRRYGMNVIFGMESIPYDNQVLSNRKNVGFWENSETKQNFIDTANYIARAFKNTPEIFALQFMSEPINSNGQLPSTWMEITNAVIQAVREHTDKFIVWSPCLGGRANCYQDIAPLEDDRIIYNFHAFYPHYYTHQGIKEYPVGVPYMGLGNMPIEIKRIIKFRDRNNGAPIMCGSYGVTNWIVDADQWVMDMHTLFNKNNVCTIQFATGQYKGWDWRLIGSINDLGKASFKYDTSSKNRLWKEFSLYLNMRDYETKR